MPEKIDFKKSPTVSTEGIRRKFASGSVEVNALKGVDISAFPGEITLLMGKSGSGKTTLLNIIGAMDKPTEGTVMFDGVNISELNDTQRDIIRREKMGFVFQSIALISLMSAYENVDFALRISKYDKKKRNERVLECLKLVGLSSREKHMPAELSGGEQQRIAIARAISHNPKLLLADEPTAELDTHLSLQVVKLFRKLAKQQNVAVVMTSHDPNMAELADHIYSLKDGVIVDEKFNDILDEETS